MSIGFCVTDTPRSLVIAIGTSHSGEIFKINQCDTTKGERRPDGGHAATEHDWSQPALMTNMGGHGIRKGVMTDELAVLIIDEERRVWHRGLGSSEPLQR